MSILLTDLGIDKKPKAVYALSKQICMLSERSRETASKLQQAEEAKRKVKISFKLKLNLTIFHAVQRK